jgi:prepilin-type processing-associated H-X9-DG protein
VNASYLYVDGHVKVYTGSRLVPGGVGFARRMPLPGIVQYFVNDLRGCPLPRGDRGGPAATWPRACWA